MKLLAFTAPDEIYYSDSCPGGLGGYSNQEFAWPFKVPNELLFCATNNWLEYLVAIISPWIDLINRRLTKRDCTLSMMDSSTAVGWMKQEILPNRETATSKPKHPSTRLNAPYAFSWTATSRGTASVSPE